MSLFGPGNFFPVHEPDRKLGGDLLLRTFLVGDAMVPLIALDVVNGAVGNDGSDGKVDETGRSLWPSSTLVVSLMLRICEVTWRPLLSLSSDAEAASVASWLCSWPRRWSFPIANRECSSS